TRGTNELVHQVYGGFSFLLDHVIVVAFVGFAFDDPVGAALVLGNEIGIVIVAGGVRDGRALVGVETFPPQDVFGKVQAHGQEIFTAPRVKGGRREEALVPGAVELAFLKVLSLVFAKEFEDVLPQG